MSTPTTPVIPAVAASPQPQYVTVVPFKKVSTAWLLFLFGFGVFSSHQFYLGNTKKALWRLFTFQYATVAIWIDLFTLTKQVRAVNAELSARTGVASPTA